MKRIYLGRGLGDGKLEAALRELLTHEKAALACTGEGEFTWAYIRALGDEVWHVHCGLPPNATQPEKGDITEWEPGLYATITLHGGVHKAAEQIRGLFKNMLEITDVESVRLTIE